MKLTKITLLILLVNATILLSILLPYSYEGEPLSNVVYALMDIDSNGIHELLIGAIAGDSFVDKMIVLI